MVAGPPCRAVEIPAAVRSLAAGYELRAVWENEVGGLTFEATNGPDRRFVKWAPTEGGVDLHDEATRLSWAATFTPVPRVLDCGGDETGTWLMTEAVPGESAVSERWKDAPQVAVAAIGEGLRALHDALPVARCPFSWSADDRLTDVQRRAALGMLDPAKWHVEHRGLTVDHALGVLAEIPPIDHVVVCHGDACAPNTLLSGDGRWSGHVDLGAMGVADRWSDLAIATWSTQWNYGQGLEDGLLAAYGIEADSVRIGYYRLLWDLGP